MLIKSRRMKRAAGVLQIMPNSYFSPRLCASAVSPSDFVFLISDIRVDL
jgi:hypothetical protein